MKCPVRLGMQRPGLVALRFESSDRGGRPGITGEKCCEASHNAGKLDFYLEALDRDVRKAHEQPSIGVLLCASKDDEVVEYALSRTLSPTLIAEYQTQLPDKKLLRAKLHEFYLQNAPEEVSDRPSANSKHRIRKKVL